MTATIHAPATPAEAKAARWQQKIDDIAAETAHIRGTDSPDNIARRVGYASLANLLVALRNGGHDTLADQLENDRDEYRRRYRLTTQRERW